MSTVRYGLLFAFAGLAVGCVDRRFVVETNVPGAQVSMDGVPIGATPADARFEYAGKYEFKAVAPGYEPLTQLVTLKPKWHNYPPLDFFAEVLWPFRIEDVRRVQLVLEPVRPVNQIELIQSADALRARGLSLPPPTVQDETTLPPRPPQPAPLAAPPTAPLPTNLVPPFQVGPTVPAQARRLRWGAFRRPDGSIRSRRRPARCPATDRGSSLSQRTDESDQAALPRRPLRPRTRPLRDHHDVANPDRRVHCQFLRRPGCILPPGLILSRVVGPLLASAVGKASPSGSPLSSVIFVGPNTSGSRVCRLRTYLPPVSAGSPPSFRTSTTRVALGGKFALLSAGQLAPQEQIGHRVFVGRGQALRLLPDRRRAGQLVVRRRAAEDRLGRWGPKTSVRAAVEYAEPGASPRTGRRPRPRLARRTRCRTSTRFLYERAGSTRRRRPCRSPCARRGTDTSSHRGQPTWLTPAVAPPAG